jgi:hypothetical protein
LVISLESTSDFSTEAVPTRIGWPRSTRSAMSSMTAPNLAASVLKMRSPGRSAQRPVGGDLHHVQPVGALELGGVGLAGAGHAGELVVHPEVVLQGDGGEGLVLLLDPHALLGLHRLVQTLGPASALEDAAGELVDDLHLAVGDDVVLVPVEQFLGPQGHAELVHQVLLDAVVEVLDPEGSSTRSMPSSVGATWRFSSSTS